MKKVFVLLFVLLCTNFSFSQQANEIRGSMGIDFLSIPSVQDYINQNRFAPVDNQVGDFSSAVNFSGAYGRMVSENYQLAVEIGYLIYSYASTDNTGRYDLTFSSIMPSILNYYVINGSGYSFKFGGGAGIRIVSADELLPGRPSKTNYSSTGFGLILRAEANTLLGGKVYAHIGTDLRYDINGEPENNGEALFNNILKENVNFNSLSFGIRLGLSYIF